MICFSNFNLFLGQKILSFIFLQSPFYVQQSSLSSLIFITHLFPFYQLYFLIDLNSSHSASEYFLKEALSMFLIPLPFKTHQAIFRAVSRWSFVWTFDFEIWIFSRSLKLPSFLFFIKEFKILIKMCSFSLLPLKTNLLISFIPLF